MPQAFSSVRPEERPLTQYNPFKSAMTDVGSVNSSIDEQSTTRRKTSSEMQFAMKSFQRDGNNRPVLIMPPSDEKDKALNIIKEGLGNEDGYDDTVDH